jgi:hypothetical protein
LRENLNVDFHNKMRHEEAGKGENLQEKKGRKTK